MRRPTVPAVTFLMAAACTHDMSSTHQTPPAPPACFGEITTGKNSLYHPQQGVTRNDLSGAATDGQNIVFDDDGGDPGADFGFNFVRVTSDLPDVDGYNVPLSMPHSDLEGATYSGGFFYVTTSLSGSDVAQQLLTRFRLDAANRQLLDEQSVNLVDDLKQALRVKFGDAWFNSWKDLPAKSGGLNVEGLSATDTPGDAVIFGLRSPLFGGDFPTNLHSGQAILATVRAPFGGSPTYELETVDLGGLGVRGFEWIPALHSYVISAGPVEKATEYALYRLFPDGTMSPLALQGMDKLCRPESVIQLTKGGKDYLVVLSEDSGPECANTAFSFIRAEITPTEQRCKDR